MKWCWQEEEKGEFFAPVNSLSARRKETKRKREKNKSKKPNQENED